jgi:hypothetical protein
MLASVLPSAISVSLHLALASASPRVAIVVTSGAEDARAPLEAALAARADVVAQPRVLVDEVLAAAGQRCATDDVTCWVKLGLDGDFQLVVLAVGSKAGPFELSLVDIAAGTEVRRSTLDNPQGAAAALARLLDSSAPQAVVAAPAEGAPGWMDPALITVGVAGAAIGAACGIAVAVVDPSLEKMVRAAANGTRRLPDAYARGLGDQNLMLGCAAAAGIVAVAATVGALVTE